MEDFGILTGFLITGLLIAFPLFYYFIYEPFRILLRVAGHLFLSKLRPYEAAYLEKNLSFYHMLSPQLKVRFERRVASFLRYKKFVGVDVEVTGEMKLFIAACAIQLTFGLRNFWLTEFDEIRVHKESYQIANHHPKALGHVSGRGLISLSWNDLQKGFQNPADGINVGLHEMAHSLYLSSVKKGWDLKFALDYKDFEKEAIIEWKAGKDGHDPSLRGYAYTNLYEFFAVCVEYFFEKSAALKAAAPRLYVELQRLLRLNPMNHEDPILHNLPVIFPSQPIPLPQYEPVGLMSRVFSNLKNLMYFLSGSTCWFMGIVLIYRSVRFDFDFPDENNPFENWVLFATALFFIGGFLYIQVFYEDKNGEQ